ncbi:glycosyltransferase family protein [Candidatus Enterovibrio altilux]|uniref:Glycosyltransferase SypN n=1 Tax=Candidatus Enterovibrio altilux TaxID=1927128 RepID=A0A291B8U1_9GAMM|nr:glycosyltransferase [Candidatus Enterovibrio luxaltus]ATF09429.1 Glycosyltransferase SypN [Candidatus Enterovibrio luxaltus]
MNRDLIVFGEDWGGLPSSTQHLIQHLAPQRKVIWINSIGLRQPRLSFHDIKRAWYKLIVPTVIDASVQITNTPHNITVVNPTTLPAPRAQYSRKLAANWLTKQLLPIIKQTKLHNPILWTSIPTAVDMANKLGAKSLVYYCCDDFSSLVGVDHDTVTKREVELIEKADLILASSEILFNRFPKSRTHLLPHGVDYKLFSTPVLRAGDMPYSQRPIAGFYGSLSEWLNYSLLDAVISALPNWGFVFIGQICKRAVALKEHNNVILLGSRPHHLLPTYSQHWTASLLPFTDNAQINACNPLKLREYLATGIPVISTPFPALKSYSDFVSKVKTPHEMIQALIKAQFKRRNEAQQNAVKSHTWAARAKELERWLSTL